MSVLILRSPIFLALVVALQRNLRRMPPILVAAPRTDERITITNCVSAMGKAISLRRASLVSRLGVVACGFQVHLVISDARHPLFSDVQSLGLFTATVAAGFVVYYLVLAIRKIRQTSGGLTFVDAGRMNPRPRVSVMSITPARRARPRAARRSRARRRSRRAVHAEPRARPCRSRPKSPAACVWRHA